MYIRRRERDILEILLKNQGLPISRYDIAQQLGVSSRTVHRELNNLDATLAPFEITIQRPKNQGLLLVGAQDDLARLQQELGQDTVIDLSTEEQKVIILYALIQSNEPVKQVGLASEIGASLQQLSKVLDALEHDLNQFKIELIRKRGVGVSIRGSEMHKRELLSQLMMERLDSTSVYSVIENHFVFQSLNHHRLPMVDMKEIFQVERLLMDDLDQLPYALTESSYLALIVHIVLSIERMRHEQYVSINDETMTEAQATDEYHIACKISDRLGQHYGITFTQAEVAFITIHLRGSKRKNDREDQQLSQNIPQVAALIDRVATETGLKFNNMHELKEGLLLHLTPALNRIHAKIETYNPMTTRIQSAYPLLFQAVQHAVTQLWPNLHFPDHEIAFLVLHFGGAVQKRQHASSVLVVCSSGVGTSRILANRLEETFPMIDRTTQMSVSDLKSHDLKQYDAIISTVELDLDLPYLTVNPLLPEHEIAKTSAFLHQQLPQIAETHTSFINNATAMAENDVTDVTKVNQKIDAMRESLQLLDAFEVLQTDLTDWSYDIAQHLYQKEITHDLIAVQQLLKERHDKQSFVLSPFRVAIPHLMSAHIETPYIGAWHLATPYDFGEGRTVDTLFCVFLPETTQLQRLVSGIFGQLSLALDAHDDALSDAQNIEQWIKHSIIKLNQL
ncbi:PTS lactose transporter subunit IIB [Staphylococcus intermedius]|uniref:BglG family transcription antiterminator n=1 Tax=Staphylococcus intermedius TaxID=1285 RepID=UPI000BBBAF82|nr:BglG family transcription antiterminator [Staphylococcus intermedius]PCF62872.1 PTS lactose transporter subunit IIB [Staphylococcus intermedius]PCF77984.1 PTS lactose transporter subunit IIB [Staphylococcus intermedius]PCF78336.1 PTS lactose transporter subunit IIB [Staphylococcus intermedius]